MNTSNWKIICHGVVFAISVFLLVFMMIIISGCERREMYVYGEEFHSVTLDVDWRNYGSDPDGMTYWFYPLDDPSHKPYTQTTANVRHHDLYLPGGHYQGVIIDYSPEEYSRQKFFDLDSMRSVRVEATPSSYQPDTLTADTVNWQLYGEPAWNDVQQPRTPILESTGLYVVDNEPEEMALDTLQNILVYQGAYGDYIPWRERDNYQSTLTVQNFYSWPASIIWKLRIRVWIKQGFNYIWHTPASITGLADGHFLALDTNTDKSCMLSFDSWELDRTGENEGYLGITLSTFGLRPASFLPDWQWNNRAEGTRAPGDTEPDYQSGNWYAYRSNLCLPEELRLNLCFTLRDHATTLFYHFNVGQCVVSFDEQLVLRIDLGPDFFFPNDPNGPDPIILPYVDAYNGTGFDAVVTPWEEEDPVDINM